MPDQNNNNLNPFHIPDLSPMYEAVRDYVKENQKDKGYILTQNNSNDSIWALLYNNINNKVEELQVKAVKVDEHNRLKVMVGDMFKDFTDETVKETEADDESIYGYEAWIDVRDDENLFFNPTIFSIAESVAQYVNNPAVNG